MNLTPQVRRSSSMIFMGSFSSQQTRRPPHKFPCSSRRCRHRRRRLLRPRTASLPMPRGRAALMPTSRPRARGAARALRGSACRWTRRAAAARPPPRAGVSSFESSSAVRARSRVSACAAPTAPPGGSRPESGAGRTRVSSSRRSRQRCHRHGRIGRGSSEIADRRARGRGRRRRAGRVRGAGDTGTRGDTPSSARRRGAAPPRCSPRVLPRGLRIARRSCAVMRSRDRPAPPVETSRRPRLSSSLTRCASATPAAAIHAHALRAGRAALPREAPSRARRISSPSDPSGHAKMSCGRRDFLE